MPYAPNQQDNWTQDRVLNWEREYQADILRDWDSWPLNSPLNIGPAQKKNTSGGRIRWLVNVNANPVQGTAYVAPDYAHTVVRRRINATLDFVQAFVEFAIPEEEEDFYASDPIGYIDLKADEVEGHMYQMLEYVSDSIWNGTGVLPGVFTGLDTAINDAVGANIYAGINRTTYPRWEANVDRTAFALWAGTVSTNIWPLYLRSRVDGKRPTHMICSMSPLTAFHRLMENRQYNTSISPTLGKQSQYHGEPTDMTFMNMIVDWGGDQMPAGEDGVDIFGLRMDGIYLQHATPNLLKMYDWELYQNNHFHINKIRSNAQYVVKCPENHFRVYGATVPDDPTSEPE